MAANKHPLVIVESPAKARTLKRVLGENYRIEASVGHIRGALSGFTRAQGADYIQMGAQLGPLREQLAMLEDLGELPPFNSFSPN